MVCKPDKYVQRYNEIMQMISDHYIESVNDEASDIIPIIINKYPNLLDNDDIIKIIEITDKIRVLLSTS